MTGNLYQQRSFGLFAGIAREMRQSNIARIMDAACRQRNDVVKCCWIRLGERFVANVTFFLSPLQFKRIFFRKGAPRGYFAGSSLRGSDSSLEFGFFGFPIFCTNGVEYLFAALCSGVSTNVGAIGRLPLLRLSIYSQLYTATFVTTATLQASFCYVAVFARGSEKIPSTPIGPRFDGGNDWASIQYDEISHCALQSRPHLIVKTRYIQDDFYEGGGTHSVQAKNRNRKVDHGPLFGGDAA
jgi:hypothetical protein